MYRIDCNVGDRVISVWRRYSAIRSVHQRIRPALHALKTPERAPRRRSGESEGEDAAAAASRKPRARSASRAATELPPFPPRTLVRRTDERFVRERVRALNEYLQAVQAAGARDRRVLNTLLSGLGLLTLVSR